jgi:hypothetical protein
MTEERKVEETDVVFFINSAMNVVGRSLYSNDERFKQTMETIESIDKYCPNNIKYMIEGSCIELEEEKLEALVDKGVRILYTGKVPEIYRISSTLTMYGIGNSLTETLAGTIFVDWFIKNEMRYIKAKRVCKLSGRYKINDNWKFDDENFKDKYVFVKHHPSNAPSKDQLGLTGLFVVRCWHMDYSLLDNFRTVIENVYSDCANLGIDAENSYYKNIPKDKLYEVEKIGVEGYVSPVGVYENE